MDDKSLSLVDNNGSWFPVIFQGPEMSHEPSQLITLNPIKYTHELDRIFICIVGEEEFDRVFAERKVEESGDVSKGFVVMYEDGRYYGSFSPLSVWETYKRAEIAEKKWRENNPNKQTVIEEVKYEAC